MKWGAFYRQSPKTVIYRRRKRRTASVGYFTPEQWQTLCAFFDGKCARCGKAGYLSPDHIIPASRGGTTWPENLQPLCPSCNVRKSNIYTNDYRPQHVKDWAEAETRKNMKLCQA